MMADDKKDQAPAKPVVDGTSKVKTEYVQINNSFDGAIKTRPPKSSGGSDGSGKSGGSKSGGDKS